MDYCEHQKLTYCFGRFFLSLINLAQQLLCNVFNRIIMDELAIVVMLMHTYLM